MDYDSNKIDRVIAALKTDSEAVLGFFSLKSLGSNPTPENESTVEEENALEDFGKDTLQKNVLEELTRILSEEADNVDAVAFDSGYVDGETMQEIEADFRAEEKSSQTKKVVFGLLAFTITAGSIIWYRKAKKS
jgi:hypothetical protein